METNVTKTIDYFIEYLNINWSNFKDKVETIKHKDEWQKKDLLADWMQFNWEIFVESFLCKNNEYLESYGEGAECNKSSDRVRFPEKRASHKIICKSRLDVVSKDYLTNNLILPQDKEFYKFVSFDGKYYSESPPFNYTLVQDNFGEYFLFKNEEVFFFISPLPLVCI
ncbi:hypothetical protein [Tenacibaculum discolor]|uniref:hypothetical protein n=1 Tax=Tenacibaculum discolor TaxID=361581 RepID=UPI003F7A4E66